MNTLPYAYTVGNYEELYQQTEGKLIDACKKKLGVKKKEELDQEVADKVRQEWMATLRNAGIVRYRIKVIDCGPFREVECYPLFEKSMKKREKAALETKAAQLNLNNRNRQKHFIRVLNTNFGVGDYHFSFEYDNEHLPADSKSAMKFLQRYFRRIKTVIKKRGYPELKYAVVTEYEDNEEEKKVRIHHHVIMNFPDRDLAERMWDGGSRTHSRMLQPDDFGLEGLARYVTKMKGKRKNEKTYSTSRNLKKYKVRTSDTKMTKRRATRLFRGELEPSTYFEKEFKTHIFTDMATHTSDYVDGCYLYVRMRSKTIYNELNRQRC